MTNSSPKRCKQLHHTFQIFLSLKIVLLLVSITKLFLSIYHQYIITTLPFHNKIYPPINLREILLSYFTFILMFESIQ